MHTTLSSSSQDSYILLQDDGIQAISDLEASLRKFSSELEQDASGLNGERIKQEIPALQQDALKYVGRIEEAMVQGFPFKVPEKYANLPQLKVHISVFFKLAVCSMIPMSATTATSFWDTNVPSMSLS